MAHKQTIYQPLKTETLRRFAAEVGTLLALQQDDARYADPAMWMV